jgi:hypothetical protein
MWIHMWGQVRLTALEYATGELKEAVENLEEDEGGGYYSPLPD